MSRSERIARWKDASAPCGEIRAYGDLDADDRARLVALHAVLAPQFAAIADAFFAARATPGTAAILDGDEPVDGLRRSLIEWMSSGLLGPYDDVFRAKRARIARRHIDIRLSQHVIVTTISLVRRAYHDRIVESFSRAEAQSLSHSVDKLLDVELAMMLRDYQLDSEATVIAGEQQRQSERVEALQTLCAGLAHEVRNPLNSAKLQLELTERRLRRAGDDPRLVEPIVRAHHEIDRLTTLLDEFLSFARPPALDVHDHDVVAVVCDVLELERPIAIRRAVELELDGAPTPVVAEIDASKLHQIINNLVANALEAVTAGGHVSVAVVPSDRDVHIRVCDDGAGITADVLARIYEPFFSTKEGGTGMGMSIVHSLVALHHGTIDVTSSPAGTTFDVAIPRRTRP